MTIHIRKAQSKDIHQLAELARVGYETSPVYRFVRTRAREFPADTEKSYHKELRVLMENPKLMFDVLEVDADELRQFPHVTKQTQICNVQERSSKLNLWNTNFNLCHEGNEIQLPRDRRIVGFAIWRLGAKSNMIHESFLKNMTCKYRVKMVDEVLSC